MFIVTDCDSAFMPGTPRYLVIPLLIALCTIFAGCTSNPPQTAAPAPSQTSGTMPGLTITAPADGAVLQAGNITVSVQVSNFGLVPEYWEYIPGKGHLHYYLDLPTNAVASQPGFFVPTTDTSYTWPNVPPGIHTFTVELASTDHTPLLQTVSRTVTVKVVGLAP
jgi:hypothetical protein